MTNRLTWIKRAHNLISVLFAILNSKLMGRHRERYAWLYSFLLATFFAVAVLLVFNRMYDYVDDLTLRDYVRNGMISPFSGHLFSVGLIYLYQHISNNIPWYALTLWMVKIISLTIVLYLVMTKQAPRLYRMIVGGLVLLFFIPFLMRFSWNTSSIVLGGVAVVAMIDALLPGRAINPWKVILLGCMVGICYEIRRDGIMMIVLDLIPPLTAYVFLLIILKKVPLVKTLLYVALFAMPVLSVIWEDGYFVRNGLNPAQKQHDIAQETRAPVYGYGVYGVLTSDARLMELNGWSATDVYMIAYAMTMFDENTFSPERFLNVINPERGPGEQAIKRDTIYNWLHFGQLNNFKWTDPYFDQYNLLPYYLAMLTSMIFVALGGKHFYHSLFAISYLGYIYLTSIYMVNYIKFPWYLSHSVYFLFCLVLLINMQVDYPRFNRRIMYKIGLFLILGLSAVSLVVMGKNIFDLNAEISQKRTEYFSRYIDFKYRFGEDAFIFIRPQLYVEYYTDPLYLGDQGPDPHYAVLGVGSAAFSPIFYEYLHDNLNISYGYQLLPWMIDNPEAYMMSKETKIISWLKTFIFETFNISVDFEPIYVYPDGLKVYRLIGVNQYTKNPLEIYRFDDNIASAIIESDDPEGIQKKTFLIKGQSKFVLFEHPSAKVTYQILVPPASFLRFSPAISPEAWAQKGDGVQFTVMITDAEGTTSTLYSQYINPKLTNIDQNWFNQEINLKKWSGQQVSLTFETSPGPNGDVRFDWAGWGDPILVQYPYYNFTKKFYLAEPPPESLNQERVSRFQVDGSFTDVIYQHPPNALSYPVHVLPDSVFSFGYGFDPVVWSVTEGDGVRFDIEISTQMGNYLLWSRYIDPKNVESDRRWFYESIDMGQFAGQDVNITLKTWPDSSANPGGNVVYDWSYWVNPRLFQVQPSPTLTTTPATSTPARTPTPTPQSQPTLIPTYKYTPTPGGN